jgi:ATPase subunit of ABC transporter with duplicated ATPase domains
MASYDVARNICQALPSGLGFAREAWDRPCAALSGGWQMRVALERPDYACRTKLVLAMGVGKLN